MKVEFSLEAMEDRESAFAYVAGDNFNAAVRIDDAVEKQCEALADFPQMGRFGRVEGTRELPIHSTPYLAIYKTSGEAVQILRVLHGSQQWPKH